MQVVLAHYRNWHLMWKQVGKYALMTLVLSPFSIAYTILYFSSISNHRTISMDDWIVFILFSIELLFCFFMMPHRENSVFNTTYRYTTRLCIALTIYAIFNYCRSPMYGTLFPFIWIVCSTDLILLIMYYLSHKRQSAPDLSRTTGSRP